jgi:phospholipid/cholesterol/gamma-HCH transport system substrate-binding protein
MKGRDKIRLGIFIIVGLLVFTGGLYFIGKKQNLFGSTFRISGIFNNVSGLKVGNNVRFSGIDVGTVENIIITSDTTVRVDMVIEESTRKFIKKDAKALIGSEGLMGNRLVNILPGSPNNKIVQDGDAILTEKPLDVDAVISKLSATTENTSVITENLAVITTDLREGKGPLGRLITDESMGNELAQTLKNMNQGTRGLSENMEAAKHNILLRGYFKKKEKERRKKGN